MKPSVSCGDVLVDEKWTATIANFGLNNVHSDEALELMKQDATYYIAPEVNIMSC